MKPIFAYPGCFTPPTHGHFRIAEKASEIFPEVVIVCSTNKEKDGTRWYSEEECRDMWKHYPLPANVVVKTFTEYATEGNDFNRVVMVRGVRDEEDLENEKRVMKLNKEKYGIDKLFYILAEDKYAKISASRVRKAAQEFDFQTLSECVAPAIITILLKRVMSAKNVFMVVGRPGSGKSTFLKMLADADNTNIHVNTDNFSKAIKPMLQEKFGHDTNMIELAIKRDKEMTEFVAPLWFDFLAKALREVPKDSNVFLEIPYGLKPGKELYRYVGNNVVYVGCENQDDNHRRVAGRGTNHHARFVSEIPDLAQSLEIARLNGLEMMIVDTSGTLHELRATADSFTNQLN